MSVRHSVVLSLTAVCVLCFTVVLGIVPIGKQGHFSLGKASHASQPQSCYPATVMIPTHCHVTQSIMLCNHHHATQTCHAIQPVLLLNDHHATQTGDAIQAPSWYSDVSCYPQIMLFNHRKSRYPTAIMLPDHCHAMLTNHAIQPWSCY